jgi:hypothetical protein
MAPQTNDASHTQQALDFHLHHSEPISDMCHLCAVLIPLYGDMENRRELVTNPALGYHP